MVDQKRPETKAGHALAQDRLMQSLSKSPFFLDIERLAKSVAQIKFPIIQVEIPKRRLEEIDQLRRSFENIGRVIEHFVQAVQPQLKAFSEHGAKWFIQIAERQRVAKICIGLGLFPHNSILQQLRISSDPAGAQIGFDLLHEQIWPHLKQELMNEIESYGANEISKCVIEEAIRAHEAECYNLVPPAIFAHIERACNLMMNRYETKGRYYDWLIKEVGNLGLSEIGGLEALEIYKHLREGAYISVANSEIAEQIHFPNRHAVIHGHVDKCYKIDSLNALLFGNFVFRALGAIESQYVAA